MPFTLQLRDAKESLSLKSVSGLCSDSPEWLTMLNEVMRRLLRKGGWWNTEFLMRLCIFNRCVVFPRIVGTVLGARFCTGDYQIRNEWWEIIGARNCCPNFVSTMPNTFADTGTTAIYRELTGAAEGKYIRFYITKLQDAGKQISLWGTVPGNQPIQQNIDGRWQRGYTLTLQSPYVQTPFLVSRIDSVVKQVTSANVLGYEVDPTTGSLRDIALYEPTETHPMYRKSNITNYCCIPTGCSSVDSNNHILKSMEILAKLNFYEVLNDEDFLPMSNMDAVKFGFQAVRLEEANQDGAAGLKWAEAVAELNMELREKYPGNQTVVRVRSEPRSVVSAM